LLAPVIDRPSSTLESPLGIGGETDESRFYEHYAWCLNPHLTVLDTQRRLAEELRRVGELAVDWQRAEAAVNVWLLGGAILNAADERLRGRTLKLPKPLVRMKPLRSAGAGIARLTIEDKRLRRWRDAWLSAFERFLPALLPEVPPAPAAMGRAAAALRQAAEGSLPEQLAGDRAGLPSPFQRLDLTHRDVLALANRLILSVPNRSTPVALIGLRTSGSYFAPLIKVALEAAGYNAIAYATLEPNKGISRTEGRVLVNLASQRALGVLVDDPPESGSTLLAALDIARRCGFSQDNLRLLVPTHPAKRDWAATLPESLILTLAPEEWHKRNLLERNRVETALKAYLGDIKVIDSERANVFSNNLRSTSPEKRVRRLKRVYEVVVQSGGQASTAFVLAKSVGWGWLSYHAFLAAHRLAGYVPQLIGLREGILYSVYVPHAGVTGPDPERIASYVAARTRTLGLGAAVGPGPDLKRHNNGSRLLERSLSRAYGSLLTATLMRSRIGGRLRRLPCPSPTWIDGNMRADEWTFDGKSWLKTDYEHHGMGKGGLNVVDPGFDLGAALLDLDLRPDAERHMLQRYAALSGDRTIDARMLVNKLMAGLWSMNRAQEVLLTGKRSADELQNAHSRFVAAWHALTVETARFAGRFCRRAQPPSWNTSPIMLDVDGVIDRRVFGFPATTGAGIAALSALNRLGCPVALNTARSVAEVQAYCEAYGFSGGVAEYGGYFWDAVRGEGHVLIDRGTAEQLESLRDALGNLPGVFLDPRHLYSIRAFTYRQNSSGLAGLLHKAKTVEVGEGAVAPLSPIVVNQILHDLALDRLTVHQTTIDTTISARSCDKGTGLRALIELASTPSSTTAVGDNEADLPMFRAATRSFAPSNIRCRNRARLLGCEIVSAPYQRGLLEIARLLGGPAARVPIEPRSEQEKLILEILHAADRPWTRHLLAAVSDPTSLRIFWH
jgi:hydroxymethylpyrimidine pyrophosphatase-like HAD family hydrolase